uniref:Xylose isomerase n=1 Tax=Haptolina ericina TaxID=156174 RepID=A0A7S3ATI6_9EUKA
MKDWLRFAVCYWHTWRGNGADIFGLAGTQERPWDTSDTLEGALERVDVHFEFCQKLGVELYCFHDRDAAPEGATIAESERIFDQVVDKLAAKQKETGISLLWATPQLFSHARYMNGAATNPDPAVVCHAAAQVKKCLDVAKRLGGENFVLWGGRDGYQCLLNTDYKQELTNYAAFLRATADYAKEIGFTGQLLLEPKPREPMAHQYNFDSETTLGFLDHHGLIDQYALNLEANHGTLAGHSGEHEVEAAVSRGKLGSIDANRNETLLGWDTDMFPTDPALSTYIMKRVIDQGGLEPGGLNFDAKVRRESSDVEDLFIGHINGMDNYARGLRAAAKLIADGTLDSMRNGRYSAFSKTPIGKRFTAGKASLTELAAHAVSNGEPKQASGQQEKYESIFNAFAYRG